MIKLKTNKQIRVIPSGTEIIKKKVIRLRVVFGLRFLKSTGDNSMLIYFSKIR